MTIADQEYNHRRLRNEETIEKNMGKRRFIERKRDKFGSATLWTPDQPEAIGEEV